MPEPGPGEVLVRIEAALTDGTDAKCYLRGHPVLLGPTPSPFGHEYAGTVAAAGPGAPFAVGRPGGGRQLRARATPASAAGPAARSSARELFPLLNGAYAEYLLVPERIARVQPLPAAGGHRARRWRRCASRWPALCTASRRARRAPATASACSGRARSGGCWRRRFAARGCEVVTLRSADPDPARRVRPRDRGGRHSAAAWERAVRLARCRGRRWCCSAGSGRHVGAGRRLPAPLRGAHAPRRLPPRAAPRARGDRAGDTRSGPVHGP